MLVYHTQGQDIEDQDIIQISTQFFYVTYDMRICTFVLYPLGGHSLQTLHVGYLSEPDVDWTWIGNIHDVLDKDIKVDSVQRRFDAPVGFLFACYCRLRDDRSIVTCVRRKDR